MNRESRNRARETRKPGLVRSAWTALVAVAVLGGCAGAPPSAAGPIGSIATEGVPSIAPSDPATASASPGTLAAPTMGVDESWIAYQWEPEHGQGLYLVRPDGSDAHEIATELPGDAFHPDWSPDGRRIALDVETGEGFEIWAVDADGTNAEPVVRRSTDCAISCGDVAEPAWSPDGRRSRLSGTSSAQAVSRRPSSRSRTSTAAIGGWCSGHRRRRPSTIRAGPGTGSPSCSR